MCYWGEKVPLRPLYQASTVYEEQKLKENLGYSSFECHLQAFRLNQFILAGEE